MSVRRPRMLITTLVLLLVFFSARPAKADSVPILSSTGTVTPSNWYVTSYQTFDFPEMFGIAFVLGQQFDNVSVTFEGTKVADFSGTAWLTNGIGPGATSANVLATQDFSNYNAYPAPVGYPPIPTLFGNIDLSPGTYYVLLSSQPCTPDGLEPVCSGLSPYEATFLGGTDSSATVAAPNIDFLGLVWSSDGGACEDVEVCPLNTEFPPGSDFLTYSPGTFSLNPAFEIDGTPVQPTPLPEPSSVFLFVPGLLALGIFTFKRSRRFYFLTQSGAPGFEQGISARL